MVKPKSREARLRRMCERRGLELRKSHARDPMSLTFAQWLIADQNSGRVIAGGPGFSQPFSLDDAEAFLRRMETNHG